MSGCIFCGVVSGAAPATKVHEDHTLCVFPGIRPITRGRMLVIPKGRAANLDYLDLGARLGTLGHRPAKASRRSTLGTDGANPIPFATGMLFRGRAGGRPDPAATAAAIRTGLDRLDIEHAGTADKEHRA